MEVDMSEAEFCDRFVAEVMTATRMAVALSETPAVMENECATEFKRDGRYVDRADLAAAVGLPK